MENVREKKRKKKKRKSSRRKEKKERKIKNRFKINKLFLRISLNSFHVFFYII